MTIGREQVWPVVPQESGQQLVRSPRWEALRRAQERAEAAHHAAEVRLCHAERRVSAASRELYAAHDACLRLEETLPYAHSRQEVRAARERVETARSALAAARMERELARVDVRVSARILVRTRLALRSLAGC